MIYITGDTHRDFSRLYRPELELKEEDLVIVLGDVGLNYFLDRRDDEDKAILHQLPCSFFFVRGNHEERPANIDTYNLTEGCGIVKGEVYIEEKYPRLMFASEGKYDIGGYTCFVTNGAYSVDKELRLKKGYQWFPEEELSEEEMKNTLAMAKELGKADFVMSHACPNKYFPFDSVLPWMEDLSISKRMEDFYNEIDDALEYKCWYCGHYHIDKKIDNIRFMYYDLIELR